MSGVVGYHVRRAVIAAAHALLAAVAVAVFLWAALTYRDNFSDLIQDYRSAHAVRLGAPLYRGEIPIDRQLKALGWERNDHPPFNALVFVPLSFVPYETAFVVLSVVSLAAYVLIGWMVVDGLGLPRPCWFYYCTLGVWWYPFVYGIALGQSSLILACLLVAGWYAERRNRFWLAGLLWSIATSMKLFPGVILVYLAIRRAWRALAAMLVWLVVEAALTVGVVGPANVFDYWHHALPTDFERYRAHPRNVSLTGCVHRLVGERTPLITPLLPAPLLAQTVAAAANVACFLLAVGTAERYRRRQTAADLSFALFCVTMLLISPLTWTHVFFVLAVPLGLVLRTQLKTVTQNRWLAVLLLLLLLGSPDAVIMRWLEEVYPGEPAPWHAALLFSAPTLGLAILWEMIRLACNADGETA
jgi:hypothetical protein